MHQNAQLYLITTRYSASDAKIHTDTVVEVVAVVGRRAAYMKNHTDAVAEVAAEVVTRRVAAEVIVTDVVLDHQVAAAKTSKKRRILFSQTTREDSSLFIIFWNHS